MADDDRIDVDGRETAAAATAANTSTAATHGARTGWLHLYDWIILLLIGALEFLFYLLHPFYRFVGKEAMAGLKYPIKSTTVPFWAVPIIAVLLPCAVFFAAYLRRRDARDLHHAVLGILYAVLVTGMITDALKDLVGRPRPDFFWRRKRGSFAGLGFFSWYVAGKIQALDRRDQCHAAKLRVVLLLLPLLAQALVSITLVNDYMHHWGDVFGGGLLGCLR